MEGKMFRILFVCFSFVLFAKETICLNMIVKNESPVIERCLQSIKPYIDYWVIVDTGSSDGTQKLIKSFLKDVPGELYERPWKNFGESRSEAFDLVKGKGDYILFMDADDTLEMEEGFQFQNLEADLYNMWRGTKDFSYLKPQLVKGDLPWKWVGVTHEYFACDLPYTSETLHGVQYVSGDGGHRSQRPDKFLENVQLLEDGLKKEPDNERYMFYLAESYRDAGEKGKALEWYQKRIARGGWAEEVFWSMLQTGHMLRDLGLPANIVMDAYLNAHAYRPHRVEPLYYLAEVCNSERNYSSAYTFIRMKDSLPKVEVRDSLFNMDWIEDYGLTFQKSICTFYLDQYREAIDACDELLANPNLPEAWRELTVENKKFPVAKLKELSK
jgi:glycosyltransferase involved in cell wall biosynthesis